MNAEFSLASMLLASSAAFDAIAGRWIASDEARKVEAAVARIPGAKLIREAATGRALRVHVNGQDLTTEEAVEVAELFAMWDGISA